MCVCGVCVCMCGQGVCVGCGDVCMWGVCVCGDHIIHIIPLPYISIQLNDL